MTETEAWKFVYEKKLAVSFPAKGTECCSCPQVLGVPNE